MAKFLCSFLYMFSRSNIASRYFHYLLFRYELFEKSLHFFLNLKEQNKSCELIRGSADAFNERVQL